MVSYVVACLFAISWCEEGVRLGAGGVVIVEASSLANAGVKEWTATRAAAKRIRATIVVNFGLKSR